MFWATALPLPPVRRKIWEAAWDPIASRDLRGKRRAGKPVSERIVDAVLVLEGLKHDRVAATLRTGIVSALEQAREADSEAEAAWRDLRQTLASFSYIIKLDF